LSNSLSVLKVLVVVGMKILRFCFCNKGDGLIDCYLSWTSLNTGSAIVKWRCMCADALSSAPALVGGKMIDANLMRALSFWQCSHFVAFLS